MEMRQVRYFLAACDTLNFTRAAERCHVSQPALTSAIKKLEDELGAPLFHREGKRVLLTEFGNMMRPQLEPILGQTERVRALAQNFRLLRRAPLNLGVMTTIGPVRLSRFFSQFRRNHPGVEVALREGALDELTDALVNGDLDLAILSAPMGLSEPIRLEQIYEERYVVVFPPGHRLKRFDAIRLQDLKSEPYVDRLACEMRDMVMALCQENEIELYATYRSEREDWIQSMVLAEMGFAFMPEYSVTLTGMLSRPLVDPEVVRSVCIATMPGRRHSPALKALIRGAREFRWPG